MEEQGEGAAPREEVAGEGEFAPRRGLGLRALPGQSLGSVGTGAAEAQRMDKSPQGEGGEGWLKMDLRTSGREQGLPSKPENSFSGRGRQGWRGREPLHGPGVDV